MEPFPCPAQAEDHPLPLFRHHCQYRGYWCVQDAALQAQLQKHTRVNTHVYVIGRILRAPNKRKCKHSLQKRGQSGSRSPRQQLTCHTHTSMDTRVCTRVKHSQNRKKATYRHLFPHEQHAYCDASVLEAFSMMSLSADGRLERERTQMEDRGCRRLGFL